MDATTQHFRKTIEVGREVPYGDDAIVLAEIAGPRKVTVDLTTGPGVGRRVREGRLVEVRRKRKGTR